MKKNKKNYILLSILLLCFILLTMFVIKGKTETIDKKFYEFVIGFKRDYLTLVLKFFTNLGNEIYTCVIMFVLFVIFLLRKKLNIYKYLFLNVISGVIIMKLIKEIIKRPRPSWKWITQGGFSYPSGHTITAILLYGTIILIINKKVKNKIKYLYESVLGIIIILIALSRIYFGVHYLTDILGGILISTIILIITNSSIKGEDNDKNKITKHI